MQRVLSTRAGSVLSVGATSASLHHADDDRMAGFNVYTFDGGGDLVDVEAHVLEPVKRTFRLESVPKWV